MDQGQFEATEALGPLMLCPIASRSSSSKGGNSWERGRKEDLLGQKLSQ